MTDTADTKEEVAKKAENEGFNALTLLEGRVKNYLTSLMGWCFILIVLFLVSTTADFFWPSEWLTGIMRVTSAFAVLVSVSAMLHHFIRNTIMACTIDRVSAEAALTSIYVSQIIKTPAASSTIGSAGDAGKSAAAQVDDVLRRVSKNIRDGRSAN